MKKMVMVFGVMVIILLPIFYIQAEESVWQVTEVMANAVNEDTGEFVEFRYTGEEEQLLSGWRISDGKETDNLIDCTGEFDVGRSGLQVEPGDILLLVDMDYAGEYFDILQSDEVDLSRVVMVTVEDNDLGNGLANSGDELVLTDQTGMVVAGFSWTKDTSNGVSWEVVSNEWQKCDIDSGNSIGYVRSEEIPNESPNENDQDSGDNSQETSESQNENNWTRFWDGGEDPVMINELMINPVGDDGIGEWIELKSNWDNDIDLSDWWLCDNKCDANSTDGGYKIENEVLFAKGFLVLERSKTKIALNNDVDSVWLFDPDHNLVASVVYDLKIGEGESFAWDEGSKQWKIKEVVTKNGENEFNEESNEEVSSGSSKETSEGQVEENQGAENKGQKTSESQNEEYEEMANIKIVKDKADGAKVGFSAMVTVTYGLLEDKYLWVSDSQSGISVKLEEDPGWAIGDKVWLAGERHDLTYRQTVLVEDWKKIGGGGVEAAKMEGDLANFEDRLVLVVGNITKTSGDDFYLSDGLGEYRVYIKENTGIIKPEMKKGESFEIIGVVDEIKSGFRILPRYQEDVARSNKVMILPSVGFDWVSLFF